MILFMQNCLNIGEFFQTWWMHRQSNIQPWFNEVMITFTCWSMYMKIKYTNFFVLNSTKACSFPINKYFLLEFNILREFCWNVQILLEFKGTWTDFRLKSYFCIISIKWFTCALWIIDQNLDVRNQVKSEIQM